MMVINIIIAVFFMVITLFTILIPSLLLFFLQKAILYLSFLPQTSVRIKFWIYCFLGLFLPASSVAGLIYYLYWHMESPVENDIYDNDQWVAAGTAVFVLIFIFLVLLLIVNLGIWMKLATQKLNEVAAKTVHDYHRAQHD